MADYIPSSDSEFTSWQLNFLSYVNANLAALGLVAADVAPVNTFQATWTADYADHIKAQALAESASQAKTATRDNFENLIRSLVRRIQSAPSVTEAQRAAMQIGLRENARQTARAPQTRPVGQIDTGQRLRHTVSFTDELTPESRAKPDGVHGCEVWVKLGDPAPVDGKGLSFLALDTRTPYIAEYDGAQAGQTAHYMLRWVNAKGEAGPWSQTVSATINK